MLLNKIQNSFIKTCLLIKNYISIPWIQPRTKWSVKLHTTVPLKTVALAHQENLRRFKSLEQLNRFFVNAQTCGVKWCVTSIIHDVHWSTLPQKDSHNISIVVWDSSVKQRHTTTNFSIHICSPLQQHIKNVCEVVLYCPIECCKTSLIKGIYWDSFIQHFNSIRDITAMHCIKEALDRCWMKFYKRNRISSLESNTALNLIVSKYTIRFNVNWATKSAKST